MAKHKPPGSTQLELNFSAPKPPPAARAEERRGLRLITGQGQKRKESLDSRDAVARVLVEAGADLLLRRISPERAEYIERTVDQILGLFDQVDEIPQLLPVLRKQLDELEKLMVETRGRRARRPG